MNQHFKNYLVCFGAFFFAAAVLNISYLGEVIFPPLVKFSKLDQKDSVIWEASPHLEKGTYFISIVQPEGACGLYQDNQLIDSNTGSDLSTQSSLVISREVVAIKDGQYSFSLVCKKEAGSPVRLRYSPYIQSYRKALSLHLVRLLSAFFLPYISAIFIVLYLLITSFQYDRKIRSNIYNGAVASGVLTTLYLVSLSTLGYLFIQIRTALLIHMVLKSLFVYSLVTWMVNNASYRKVIAALTAAFVVTIASAFFLVPDMFWTTYIYYYNCIPIIGLAGLIALRRNEIANDFYVGSASSLMSFVFLSVVDCIILNTGKGGFLSAATTLSIYGLTIQSHLSVERAKSLAARAGALMASRQFEFVSTEESLKGIADIVAECLNVHEWSVYLDSYILMSASVKGRELRRISTSSKNPGEAGKVIDFNVEETHGRLMKAALDSDKPIVRTDASSGNIYAVIPVAGVCCLNLRSISAKKFTEPFVNIFFSELSKQIKSLALSIIKAESASSLSTAILREELGSGKHVLNYGCVFADVTGYTQNVKSSETFIDFFEKEYVPHLMNSLGKRVVLKDLFGDELFLLILPDSNADEESTVAIKTVEVVSRLEQFAYDAGADACVSAGFNPIVFRIGASAGNGTITLQTSSVILTGPMIEAKRCQSRAKSGAPFIGETTFNLSKDRIKVAGKRQIFAAKKEIMCGYSLDFEKKDEAA